MSNRKTTIMVLGMLLFGAVALNLWSCRGKRAKKEGKSAGPATGRIVGVTFDRPAAGRFHVKRRETNTGPLHWISLKYEVVTPEPGLLVVELTEGAVVSRLKRKRLHDLLIGKLGQGKLLKYRLTENQKQLGTYPVPEPTRMDYKEQLLLAAVPVTAFQKTTVHFAALPLDLNQALKALYGADGINAAKKAGLAIQGNRVPLLVGVNIAGLGLECLLVVSRTAVGAGITSNQSHLVNEHSVARSSLDTPLPVFERIAYHGLVVSLIEVDKELSQRSGLPVGAIGKRVPFTENKVLLNDPKRLVFWKLWLHFVPKPGG